MQPSAPEAMTAPVSAPPIPGATPAPNEAFQPGLNANPNTAPQVIPGIAPGPDAPPPPAWGAPVAPVTEAPPPVSIPDASAVAPAIPGIPVPGITPNPEAAPFQAAVNPAVLGPDVAQSTPDQLRPPAYDLNFNGKTAPDQTPAPVGSFAGMTTESAPPPPPLATDQISPSTEPLPTPPGSISALPGTEPAAGSSAAMTSEVKPSTGNPTLDSMQEKMAGNLGQETAPIAPIEDVITNGQKGFEKVKGTPLEKAYVDGFSLGVANSLSHKPN